ATQIVTCAVDDDLALGGRVRVWEHRARAEQVGQVREDGLRRPDAGEDQLGLVPRDDRLVVGGGALDAANLDEQRRRAARVDLLGAYVVQRASCRLGVELPDVA